MDYNPRMASQVTIIVEPCPAGGFSAYIPEVPGAYSEADTADDAREGALSSLRELMEARRELTLMRVPINATVITAEL